MSMPFGFGAPDGGGFDMNALGAALQRFGQMLQQGGDEGPVRWSMVSDVARTTLNQRGDALAVDPSWVDDTMRLADLWLDAATDFPAHGGQPRAWSRQDWLSETLESWHPIIEPIAQHMQGLTANLPGTELATPEDLSAALPEQLRAMLPEGAIPAELMSMLTPMLGMVQQLGAAAFSMQLGQALGTLATEVLSSTDIGIPLGVVGVPAIVTRNVDELVAGLPLPQADVRLFVALRESAHQRLFMHVPWLRPRLIGAIEEYAKGLRLDNSRVQEALGQLDLSDPQALQSVMASGVLEPPTSTEQQAALARIETLLALVEGWVDDVVDEAIAGRLATHDALRETLRRRRAEGGPAERAFGTLVGLTLRPKAMREAAIIFQGLRSMKGSAARDGIWEHPDFLPSADDLAEPMDFLARLADDQE
jgi:putative hydrolase